MTKTVIFCKCLFFKNVVYYAFLIIIIFVLKQLTVYCLFLEKKPSITTSYPVSAYIHSIASCCHCHCGRESTGFVKMGKLFFFHFLLRLLNFLNVTTIVRARISIASTPLRTWAFITIKAFGVFCFRKLFITYTNRTMYGIRLPGRTGVLDAIFM